MIDHQNKKQLSLAELVSGQEGQYPSIQDIELNFFQAIWGVGDFTNEQTELGYLIYYTFLFAVPYLQLNAFGMRLKGLTRQYQTNIAQWWLRMNQIANMQKLLQADQSGKMQYDENITKNMNTQATEAGASYGGPTFNNVKSETPISIPEIAAGEALNLTTGNLKEATIDSSGSKRQSQINETIGNVRTMTTEQLQEYNRLQYEANNLIAPFLLNCEHLFRILVKTKTDFGIMGFDIWN